MADRDLRWSKQFGDFGEQLVMYLLGQMKNMKVACVDHAGADLIATDLGNDNNRYAISVKSRQINLSYDAEKLSLESKLYSFDDKNITHLREFAASFRLKPVVALVMVEPYVPQDHVKWIKKKENAARNNKFFKPLDKMQVNIFVFNLDDALEMSKDPQIQYFTEINNQIEGFNFKFEDSYFEDLINDPRIDYTSLSFDTLVNKRMWDGENPMTSAEK